MTGTTELSGEELATLLTLVDGADSVELKLTIPDSERRSAVRALEMDVLDGQIRQVFFFDTPQLTLNQSGVVARARRIQGPIHDSVVKLRPVVPSELPASLRRSPNLVVEVDAMPGGFVCSASLKNKLKTSAVGDSVAGRQPIHKLFSKEQRSFFARHAPEGVELDELAILGPINVLKLKFAPRQFGRRMVAELWIYPDFSRVLELSTKCKPGDGFRVAAEAKAFLAERGIDLRSEQHTKTKSALEFFAAELAAGQG